jgi:hypothetical protein
MCGTVGVRLHTLTAIFLFAITSRIVTAPNQLQATGYRENWKLGQIVELASHPISSVV